ncbi:hypothetical protein [Candidatus Methylacidithermus pantelleriae]|uniref:Uncharacterized protein n=1 Tax=Candidatus Methylacidithermus pantelleriae TaxID=2744239 RepID=A0A8J2FS92_9BACT|nr:hypothetical protein [Candidatus Methylacidithermus pantelleriae]CAF0694661.1 hypothetical protein MPNT_170026 [Candidatus Methylacidithermus pantelleriae]
MSKERRLSALAEELPTGTVIMHAEAEPADGLALYAQVCKRQ